MAGDTVITVIGNLTADPELRFTPNGAAVANFTIASTPRVFDRQTNEWKDGEALFLRCSAWKQLAENIAESLAKGSAVIAQGRLKQRSYEKDGQKRTVVELEVDEIGPSLKWATAQVTKASLGGGAQQQRGARQQPPRGQQNGGPAPDDPWATPAPQNGGYGGQQYAANEPPF
ncbi:single-stranded DNA-binding protein [Streptomyces sp. SID3343]|uniref:single-stranded DNA-binding protein n=1 Tax=Streptomyces sp. SID3343 TaxID=2690260 RepID=UPI0013685BA0|nr:single-stranded DNA-binding protein [Streptomyces sp. SID3343]MYW03483.1 single-stranded DNA-binding protein [Streptomyces sp. SID3343]